MQDSLALDLAAHLDVCVWLEQMTGWSLYPWQADLLRSNGREDTLCLCHRQAGKSSLAGALGLHIAMNEPRTNVIILAPSLSQSTELLRKSREFARDSTLVGVDLEHEAELRLELGNGSRLIALPGSQASERRIRGYKCRLLILDEAAALDDLVIHTAIPMLAVSGGAIVALSTARYRRGWFYDQWAYGGDRWKRVKVVADECRHFAPGHLERERTSKPAGLYGADYDCNFMAGSGAAFDPEDVAAMLAHPVQEREL